MICSQCRPGLYHRSGVGRAVTLGSFDAECPCNLGQGEVEERRHQDMPDRNSQKLWEPGSALEFVLEPVLKLALEPERPRAVHSQEETFQQVGCRR